MKNIFKFFTIMLSGSVIMASCHKLDLPADAGLGLPEVVSQLALLDVWLLFEDDQNSQLRYTDPKTLLKYLVGLALHHSSRVLQQIRNIHRRLHVVPPDEV